MNYSEQCLKSSISISEYNDISIYYPVIYLLFSHVKKGCQQPY